MVIAARRILKLSQEELPRMRTVLAICREAKARRQWSTMLEFAQALDRDTQSDEVRRQNDRTLPSDEQRWLYLMTQAHLELGNYAECLRLAREGMERVAMLAQMGLLLERQKRWQAAVNHLLLAWTLADRQEGWDRIAEKSREQVAEFIERSGTQLDPHATLPAAPPEAEPLLAACRRAWAEPRR